MLMTRPTPQSIRIRSLSIHNEAHSQSQRRQQLTLFCGSQFVVVFVYNDTYNASKYSSSLLFLFYILKSTARTTAGLKLSHIYVLNSLKYLVSTKFSLYIL